MKLTESAHDNAAPVEPTRGSLAIIFITVFIDLLGFGMVLPLLPIYAKEFGVDEHGMIIGLLMASFSAMQFVFAPLWGKLSDRIGRRPVLLVGLAGSAAFYFLFAVAALWRSMTWLFISRIGAGIAGATISTAQAYIADCTTLKNRTKGMALIGAAFGIGFTFGPLIGAAAIISSAPEGSAQGGLAESPWPGYVASMLSALAFVAAWFLLPESRRGESKAEEGWLNLQAWSDAFRTPSVALLLVTSFLCVMGFAGYETTLSLLLKKPQQEGGAFGFAYHQVLYMYAFVGLMLVIVQGGLVRRLSGRMSEASMAALGCGASFLGLVLLIVSSQRGELWLLLVATAVQVAGFAFMMPPLQSLISRRSDPAKQGGILGVAQGISALARIVAPLVFIPLFFRSPTLPYWGGMVILACGWILLIVAVRRGGDFVPKSTA